MRTSFRIRQPYADIFLRCADAHVCQSPARPLRFMRKLRENTGMAGGSFGLTDEQGLERKNPVIVALGDSVTAGHFESLMTPERIARFEAAIAHQLLTPSFDVRGVIAAHFEGKALGTATMEQSYRELLTLLDAAGIDDVPALRGSSAPLKDENDAPGCEGVDFLIEEALRDDPRPLYVCCQGALTDVAAALNRRPEIGERLTVVWIGGFPYPHGGPEFNLIQDAAAARAVLASKAAVWQLPVNVYSTMEVSLAELAARVRPCGALGRYLYEQLEDYNLHSDELPGLRRGENWCLGDSPVLGALLQCEWRGNFHSETAPRIGEDMRYLPNPGGKEIRVYDSVDVRFILEDMYAKLALSAR